MNDTLFSINGKIVPEAQAVLPVTDRGWLYGDGLFETLHAYGATVFKLDLHLQRMRHGMEHLFFATIPASEQLCEWVDSAVSTANFAEANVRLTVTRGSGPRGPSISGAHTPNVVITVTQHQRPPAARFTSGVRAVMASFRRQESSVTAGQKTMNYLEQILARREADLAGADEAILLNNAGLLCEGSASNLSLVREGILCVPDPERSGALPGIAQITALEAARNLRIPICQACLSPWDLTQSEEAFLSGSMRELTPLVRVGDTPVGKGIVGPVATQLIAEYRKIVERECPPFRFPY